MRALVVGLLVLVAASPAWAIEVRCEIEAKYACSQSGCRENAIAVWNLIDLDASRFSRCDQMGCDHYTITTSVSGVAGLLAEAEGKKDSSAGSRVAAWALLGKHLGMDRKDIKLQIDQVARERRAHARRRLVRAVEGHRPI